MRKVFFLIALTIVILNSQFAFAQLQGQAKIDSLLKELPKMRQDTNKVLLLNEISYLYYSIEPNKGIKISEEALKLSKKLNWTFGISRTFNTLGILYGFGKSDYDNAIKYYKMALEVNEKRNDSLNIAANLGNIGIIFKNQSNFPEALKYYLKALTILEALDSKQGIAINLANLGTIYAALENYQTALEYFYKALELNELLQNKASIAILYLNIGSTYSLILDFDKAQTYFLKSLRLNQELGNLTSMSMNLVQLGILKKNLKLYEEALEYLHEALEINQKVQNTKGIANIKSEIGSVFFNMAKDLTEDNFISRNYKSNKEMYLKNSIENIKESNAIYIQLNMKNEVLHNFMKLSDAYILQNNYRDGLIAFKEYKTLQDSVFSMDRQKEFATLEAKRENELKDKEIIILQTEKKAQQFQSYLLGGGVIVLLGAFGIAFIRFREKKKLSDKLSIQKSEIENQKSIVEEKNEQIVASITYASTIQHAILPWDSTLKSAFLDILIFYKPKDIVSGDSYWFKEVDGIKFLAVIDCTGHGIPGAMLTVIASSVLDDAVLSKRLNDTALILTYMNEKVTEVLNQRLTENSIRDGMEVALIAIHQDKIQFSGAGRPLYMKNGTMEIIKTDKRGIAGQTDNDEYQFSSIEIEKSENLMLYLSSDGYADQMNEQSKKYSTKRFVALLDTISEKPISEQHDILENEFNSHKGERSQIDDVTILGVRI